MQGYDSRPHTTPVVKILSSDSICNIPIKELELRLVKLEYRGTLADCMLPAQALHGMLQEQLERLGLTRHLIVNEMK